MNPLTHLLVGWSVAHAAPLPRRERALVTLAGVAPDVDGLGLAVDQVARSAGHFTNYWGAFHHVVAHNVFAGLLLTAAAFALARARRGACAVLALLSFHLHLLGDLVGSGGPDGYVWSLHYLYPLSDRAFAWSGQWDLNAWPNWLVTAALLALALRLARTRGRSPLELLSPRADARLVEALGGRAR